MKKIAMCIGALVLATGAGSFWYGRHDKIKEIERQKQESVLEQRVELKPAPSADWYMNMYPDAYAYFRNGLDRMKAVGVEYTEDQVVVMTKCADRDYNPKDKEHRLDAEEAKELYEMVLNPDAALGRLAMSYGHGRTGKYVAMPSRYEPFAQTLIDEDKDNCITKEEVRRAHEKLR